MKILQIIPTLGLAGAERMLETLAIGLSSMGDEVMVVDLFDEETPITNNLIAHGIRVDHLGKHRGIDLGMFPRIHRILCRFEPDIVHTHRYAVRYAYPVEVAHGVKARVHTVHNIASQEICDADKVLCRHFYKSGGLIPVGINESVKASIAELYSLPPGRIPLIYNGISRPASNGKNPLGEDMRFTFVHVGRFAEAKNHIGLIEGFVRFHREYDNTRLVLVGDGSLRPVVRSRIKELNAEGYVHDIGLVDAMGDVYANADSFVLPSLYEGMSIALIEAMMNKLPVLVSNRGGNVDLVNGDTGYICDVDPRSIANGLERLYLDKHRDEVALRGSKSVERYSAAAMTRSYRALYGQLLANDGRLL